MNRQPFITHNFALIICRNQFGKWLCVKETRNRGWWVAGGLVDPGEDFYDAAYRETFEEAGVNIKLEGILRIEHSVEGKQTARMRVIFFATSNDITPKQVSDEHSVCASWLSIEEIEKLAITSPGVRGPEIIDWPRYVENGGTIYPLSILVDEVMDIPKGTGNDDKNTCDIKMMYQNNVVEFIQKLVENENVEEIRKHLINGYNPNTFINEKNWTILHFAIKLQNIEIVRLLLLSGIDFSIKTHKKRNYLHFAVQYTLNIVKLIIMSLPLHSIADYINHQDINGETPMHLAANYTTTDEDGPTIYKYLLLLGGKEDIKDKNGITPEFILNKN